MPLPMLQNERQSKTHSHSQINLIKTLSVIPGKKASDAEIEWMINANKPNAVKDACDAYLSHFLDEFHTFSVTLAKVSKYLSYKKATYDLDFPQLWLLLASLDNVWLYQGQQLVAKGIITADSYIHILSLVLAKNGVYFSCSYADAKKIFFRAHQKLHDDTIIRQSCFSLFKTPKSDVNDEGYKHDFDNIHQRRIAPLA